MRYCIATSSLAGNIGREMGVDNLANRIRKYGHSVWYYISNYDDVENIINDVWRYLTDEDAVIIIPKYGVIRRHPIKMKKIGRYEFQSGVYGIV